MGGLWIFHISTCKSNNIKDVWSSESIHEKYEDAIGLMSRYMKNPKATHFKVAKRIIRYIKGTIDFSFYTHSLKTTSLLDIVIAIGVEI